MEKDGNISNKCDWGLENNCFCINKWKPKVNCIWNIYSSNVSRKQSTFIALFNILRAYNDDGIAFECNGNFCLLLERVLRCFMRFSLRILRSQFPSNKKICNKKRVSFSDMIQLKGIIFQFLLFICFISSFSFGLIIVVYQLNCKRFPRII